MHHPRPLEMFFDRYEEVSAAIGLVGNAAFFLGSVFFLLDVSLPAKLAFVTGSAGMLYRAVGRLYTDRRIHEERVHGHDGGEAMAAARRDLDTAP